MRKLVLFAFFVLTCNYSFSQTPVNFMEGFEGSWLPAGWTQAQFSQSNVSNHTSGGTFSAAHNTLVSGNGHLLTPYFDVTNGEQFDTIAFWVLRTDVSISGSVGVKIVAASNNDEDLQLIDLTVLPAGTWERFSYSYSVIRDDQIALKLSVSNTVTAGTIFFDDFRVNKSTVMPVELSAFYSIVNKNNVTLNWTTVWEMNNSGFQVQRAGTGNNQSGWSVLGFVQGHGTTNETVNYSYYDIALNTGEYAYRLKQIDYNGNYKYYELQSPVTIGAPGDFVLHQNYPNPFNASTKFKFEISKLSNVKIAVYNVLGGEVARLINDELKPGTYEAVWDATNYPSGVYYYKLTVGDASTPLSMADTKRMILIK